MMFNSFRNTSLVQAFFLCFTVSFLGSCITTKSKIKPSLNKKLSQELIFRQLSAIKKDSSGCRVYVAPILKKRNVIPKVWEFSDPGKELPAYFMLEQQSADFQLLIPDTLANRLCYTYDGLDIENAAENIYFFSPLFPTKEKNTFAIEVYHFETIHEGAFNGRIVNRYYNLYTLNEGEAQYEKTVLSELISLPILRVLPYKHKKG